MSNLFDKWESGVQRDVEKKCSLCNKDFNFMRREHQCKRCLRAVCSDCSNEKLNVYKQGFARRPHRGCKLCVEEVREVAEFIEANRLQFSRMSPMGNKWMGRIEKRALTGSIDNRKHKKFTREVYGRMWDAYNYSLRQFVGMLTFDLDQDELFRTVSDVVATVISIMPEEDLQSVAYLVVFMLCFCSADKAPFICLFLLELKATVANEQGLLQAYLKALGIGEAAQDKLKDYLRQRGKRFISALSINFISAKASIDLLQRVITKRKIDEIFIFLAISIQMLREAIMIGKENHLFCDMLMVRLCSTEATSSKYKLPSIGMVKSANFMREKVEFEPEEVNSFISNQNSFAREQKESNNPMAASFSEGIRNNKEIRKQGPTFNPPAPIIQSQPIFRKREIKEDSFIEDSFSVISMIDEMNQNNQRNNSKLFETDGNDLLNLMSQAEQKSNDSIEIKRQIRSGEKPLGFPQLNLSLGQAEFSIKDKKAIECEKCLSSNSTISTLMKEIEELKLQKAKIQEDYKRQIKNLQQKIKTSNNSKASEINSNEYESQIRIMRQGLLEYERKEKQYQSSMQRMDESKRHMSRLELQLKTAQQQLQQSAITIKMLKNKLQLQSFSIPHPRSTSDTTDALRINQILKQSLREKNQEIQELSKKNKLILYQLEQLSKQRLHDKEKIELKQKGIKLEKEKQDIIAKMKELSNLLMEMQDEKLVLSQENFELKEMLRERGVVFSHS